MTGNVDLSLFFLMTLATREGLMFTGSESGFLSIMSSAVRSNMLEKVGPDHERLHTSICGTDHLWSRSGKKGKPLILVTAS